MVHATYQRGMQEMLREMQVGFDAAAWKRERETVLEDLRVFQCSQVEQPQHSVLDILSVFSLASDAQGQPGVGGGEGNKKKTTDQKPSRFCY